MRLAILIFASLLLAFLLMATALSAAKTIASAKQRLIEQVLPAPDLPPHGKPEDLPERYRHTLDL